MIAQRITELLDLARTEQITLPMPAAEIVRLEDMGYVVDLLSGEVCTVVTVELEPNAQAVSYLLSFQEGEFVT